MFGFSQIGDSLARIARPKRFTDEDVMQASTPTGDGRPSTVIGQSPVFTADDIRAARIVPPGMNTDYDVRQATRNAPRIGAVTAEQMLASTRPMTDDGGRSTVDGQRSRVFTDADVRAAGGGDGPQRIAGRTDDSMTAGIPMGAAVPRIGAPAPASYGGATLTPGGQQFSRISAAAAPNVDLVDHGPPAAYSDPGQPLPVLGRPSSVPDRISLPDPRVAENAAMQQTYGAGGPNEDNLARMEAANIANKGRGPQRQKGAMNWLKDMGRSALRGFIKGGIGGALGGAIRGGIDPQFANEAQYYERDLPNSRAAANDERIGRQAQFNRVDDISKMTGLTPGGQPTETSRNRISIDADRDELRSQNRANQQGQNEDRDDNRRIRQDTAREASAKNHVEAARHLGRPVDPEAVKGTSMEAFAGVVPPKTGAGSTPHWAQDSTGRWVDLNSATGPVQGKVPRDPNEMTAAQIESSRRADDREDRADRREGRSETRDENQRLNNAEGSLRKAQSAINNLRRISAAGTKATPEQIDQEKANALAAVDEVVSSHPDLLEGGPGDGGFPYVKWKGGQRPAPSTPTARAPQGGERISASSKNESPTAAIAAYRAFVRDHPKLAAKARAQFEKDNPGVNPD